jgi:methionine-rich copper-binding protein CopC
MDRLNSLRGLLSVAALLTVLLFGNTAQAHAKLVSAEPASQSVGTSPARIVLHFSEALAKNFSSFTLADSSGAPITLRSVDGADAKSLAAAPGGILAPGTYTVVWTAVASDDGHKSGGSFAFTVK